MLIIPASLTAAEHVRSATDSHSSLRPSDTLRDMIDHPAFAGFGEHLLPRPQDARKNLRLNEISRIMPWHSHVRTDVMLEAVNRMIDDASAGRTVFYSFYKDGQAGPHRSFLFPRSSGRPVRPHLPRRRLCLRGKSA